MPKPEKIQRVENSIHFLSVNYPQIKKVYNNMS